MAVTSLLLEILTVEGMTARCGSVGETIHDMNLKVFPPSVVRIQNALSVPNFPGSLTAVKIRQSLWPLTM